MCDVNHSFLLRLDGFPGTPSGHGPGYGAGKSVNTLRDRLSLVTYASNRKQGIG